MMKTNYYKGKVIVITGASSGIGKELALNFSFLGAKVVIASRNETKLSTLETEIKSKGNHAISIKTDVAIESDIKNLITITLNHWNKVDIFVANAGQYIQNSVEESKILDYTKSFNVNFFGALYAVKRILPIMKNQHTGHIVFINSLDSKKGVIFDAPYVAAKSALDGFSDVLRQEVKGYGIYITTVYPGRVDTPMIKNINTPWITPKISTKRVANAVLSGIIKKKPSVVVPKIFYPIGALNDLIPSFMDWIYKKLQLEGTKI